VGAFYSKPTSLAIENLTTVYVLKRVVLACLKRVWVYIITLCCPEFAGLEN
jgi:hypothetical protein